MGGKFTRKVFCGVFFVRLSLQTQICKALVLKIIFYPDLEGSNDK